MTPLEYANTLTSDRGTTPARDIAVRWHGPSRTWNATNTIEKGWSSTAYIRGTLPHVLGRLNVIVTAIKCDDCSMYFHCIPATLERIQEETANHNRVRKQIRAQVSSGLDQAWAMLRDNLDKVEYVANKYHGSKDPEEALIAGMAFIVIAEVQNRARIEQEQDPEQT